MHSLHNAGQRRSSRGGKGFLIQEDMATSLRTNNYMTVFQPCVSVGHDIRSSRMTDDGKTDPMTATDYKSPITVAYAREDE